MNLYTTLVKTLTGTYFGPNVPGISRQDAQDYCEQNGLGYCKVYQLLVTEIPSRGYEADWSKRVDYDNHLN